MLEALQERPPVKRILLGSVAGLIWSVGMVSPWLAHAAGSHLTPAPVTAALLAGAAGFVYGGIYLAAFAAVYPLLPRPRWLMAPAAWVLLEEVRTSALGGAPWGLLGQSQHSLLPIAQLAELGGVAALSFLCVMAPAALAARGRERRAGLLAFGVTLLLAASFGWERLAEGLDERGAAATDRSVAGLSGLADAADPVAAYVEGSAALPPAALTVWPESALPGYLQDSPAALRQVRRAARQRGWLLLGARTYAGSGAARRYFNTALLVDPDGALRGTYAKSRLVPFAERSPWPFPSLVERPYSSPAAAVAPLRAGDLRVGVLICWESVFPAPAHDAVRRGADLLVNLTSDRDLGAGAPQHLAFSRFRAIETRRWLLRVSGVGATTWIDPLGRVRTLPHGLVLPAAPPRAGLVTRAAWVVPGGAALLLLLGTLLRRRQRRTANQRSHLGAKPRS